MGGEIIMAKKKKVKKGALGVDNIKGFDYDAYDNAIKAYGDVNPLTEEQLDPTAPSVPNPYEMTLPPNELENPSIPQAVEGFNSYPEQPIPDDMSYEEYASKLAGVMNPNDLASAPQDIAATKPTVEPEGEYQFPDNPLRKLVQDNLESQLAPSDPLQDNVIGLLGGYGSLGEEQLYKDQQAAKIKTMLQQDDRIEMERQRLIRANKDARLKDFGWKGKYARARELWELQKQKQLNVRLDDKIKEKMKELKQVSKYGRLDLKYQVQKELNRLLRAKNAVAKKQSEKSPLGKLTYNTIEKVATDNADLKSIKRGRDYFSSHFKGNWKKDAKRKQKWGALRNIVKGLERKFSEGLNIFGIEDKEFLSRYWGPINTEFHKLSGAAVTPHEFQRLMRSMPDVNGDPAPFMNEWDKIISERAEKLNLIYGAIESTGAKDWGSRKAGTGIFYGSDMATGLRGYNQEKTQKDYIEEFEPYNVKLTPKEIEFVKRVKAGEDRIKVARELKLGEDEPTSKSNTGSTVSEADRIFEEEMRKAGKK